VSIGESLRRVLRPVEDPELRSRVHSETDPSAQRLYLKITESSTPNWGSTEFYVFVGTSRDFKLSTPSYSVIDRLILGSDIKKPIPLRPIPEVWEAEIRELYLKENANRDYKFGSKTLGNISYTYRGSVSEGNLTAVGHEYYPRNHFVGSAATGLPYLEELMTLDYLKDVKQVKFRYSQVVSDTDPSPQRIKQLKYADLPLKVAVPIDDWRMGLIRGMEKRLEKKQKLVMA